MSAVFLAVPHNRTRGPTGQVTDPWLADALRAENSLSPTWPRRQAGRGTQAGRGHQRHLPAAIVTGHLPAPSVPSRAATRPAVWRCPSSPARP